ncbi:MAG TPA: hypothetical protein VGI39_39760 [Polyangiaceae bacterium]
MPLRPQVPRIAQIVGPAIDAFVGARPSVLPFVNNGAGRYADLPAGWEGQIALFVRRLADEAKSARVASSAGLSLTQLSASEFFTLRQSDPTAAVGRATLLRGSARPGGAIPQGFRFARRAASDASPPIPAGAYTATREVSFPAGVTSIKVPIVASLPGAASSAPYYDGDNTGGGPSLLTLEDTPFDTTIAVSAFEAAGGSDGTNDDDLRRQMRANASGRFGATTGAILAAALGGTGVHRVACFDVAQAADGTPVAYTGVAIADGAWASGSGGLLSGDLLFGVWERQVAQRVADIAQGVGGQFLLSGVANQTIRLAAIVQLRSGDDLNDTAAIDAALLKTARSYFDDRPDWWTWTVRGLRAWLSRAHPKILSCTAVQIRDLATDADLTGSPPPALPIANVNGIQATHYFLVQNGLVATYTAAS